MKIYVKGYQTTMFDKDTKDVFEGFYPIEKMGKKDMHLELELSEKIVIVDRKYITKEYTVSQDLLNTIIEENE